MFNASFKRLGYRRITFTLLGLLFMGYVAAVVIDNSNNVATPVANAATTACTTDSGKLLALINAERSVKGAPALVIDPSLVTASQSKLNDMITNKYFGHNLSDDSSEFKYYRDNGITAAGSSDIGFNGNSPESMWASFKASPGHYASLTKPTYTRVGISEQCVDFKVAKVTGPADNSKLLGTEATELSVVYLAAPEPAAAPQVQTRYVPAPTPTYVPHVSHTYCTTNQYTGSISCSTY